MSRLLDDAQVAVIAQRYLAGETMKAIAMAYGVGIVTIMTALERHGTPRRHGAEARRIYGIDDAAFDVLTPEVAYWAGFIAADGSLGQYNRRAGRLSVGLAGCDRQHLEKLRSFLHSDHPIREFKRNGGYNGGEASVPPVVYSVSSEPIYHRLVQLGVKGPSIASALRRSTDFWRGMIDGDGWLTHGARKEPAIGLCGYPYVINPFLVFLRSHGIDKKKASDEGFIKRVTTTGRRAAYIANLLYGHGGVSLDRKQAKADWFAQWAAERADRPNAHPRFPFNKAGMSRLEDAS